MGSTRRMSAGWLSLISEQPIGGNQREYRRGYEDEQNRRVGVPLLMLWALPATAPRREGE